MCICSLSEVDQVCALFVIAILTEYLPYLFRMVLETEHPSCQYT